MKPLVLFIALLAQVTLSFETLADIDIKIRQVEARLEALEHLKKYSKNA